MSEYNDFEKRSLERRFPFARRFFNEIDAYFEKMFEEMTKEVPKNLVRERRLSDDTVIREIGPFVFGYTVTLDPQNKPVIRRFGNVKPSMKPGVLGIPLPSLEVKEEVEPLIDIMQDEKTVRVIAELPGVEKDDINLIATEDTLTIHVDTQKRKFHKEVELPVRVEQTSTKASYVNGVLEVKLMKMDKKPTGKPVKIE